MALPWVVGQEFQSLEHPELQQTKLFLLPMKFLLVSIPRLQHLCYISRLPGHLGEYLALIGEKLNGVEMVSCGLATHYSLIARLSLIEEQLGKLVTDDPSVIENTLEQYGGFAYPDNNNVL